MTHPSILILSRSEAAMLLRDQEHQIAAIVSICGRHEPALDCGKTPDRLLLEFDDVDPPDASDPLSTYLDWVRRRWARETGRELIAPSPNDARQILEFAESISGEGGTVLFQCQAGISRSAAAALVALAAWTGPGNEPYCISEVKRARPAAVPHRGLVRTADRLLGREGRLIATLRG